MLPFFLAVVLAFGSVQVHANNDTFDRQVVYSVCSGQKIRIGELDGNSSKTFKARHCFSDFRIRFQTMVGPGGRTLETDQIFANENAEITVSVTQFAAFIERVDNEN